jgi:hypothetical protein
VAGSDPEHPGLVRIYKSPDQPNDRYENAWHCRRHLAREAAVRLRAALRRVPAGRRRHHVGQHGAGLRAAAAKTSRTRSPACAPATASSELRRGHADRKALALHAQFPDAEHPVVRTHPETGEKVLFVNAFTTHFTNFHTPATCATARTTPGASDLLRYLISQAAIPEYQVRWRWKPNSVAIWDNRSHPALRGDGLPALPSQRWSAPASSATPPTESASAAPHHFQDNHKRHKNMNFLDGSLFPENQDKLVITAAPYGPEWMPSDFPEDIPVTMDEQIQKAVDCYNAGATVLHLHVRELDGKGSKRLSKFNELIAGVRKAVPDMIIQVGGSISFAPEATAKPPSGCPTTRATCWPSSTRSRTRSRWPSTPRR